VVDVFQGRFQQAGHVLRGDGHHGTRGTIAVQLLPVLAERMPERLQHDPPLNVVDRAVGRRHVRPQGPGHPLARHAQLRRDLERRAGGAEQVEGEGKQAAQVGQRDHRGAVAHQGVVGVVPLGPLGVHPQARPGHEAGQAGQHQHQQLLGQPDPDRIAGGIQQQLAVGAQLGGAVLRALVRGLVEVDGALGVGHQRVERADAIGDVGVGEQPPPEQRLQRPGLEARRQLHQLQQIDHLVIAPVPDERPGVVRVLHLPLETSARDPVGVVPVGRGGVEELGDHARDQARERRRQRLPVLEQVTPVALVIEHRLAGGVADGDLEVIPRPAGIAVAAAEGQRQVLLGQAFQIGIALLARRRQQLAARHLCRQARQERLLARVHPAIGRLQEATEVVPVEGVAARGDATPLAVEQHVGEVPGGVELVGAGLQAIGGRHQRHQPLAALGQFSSEGGQGIAGDQQAVGGDHRGRVLLDVGDQVELPDLSRGQRHPGTDDVGAALSADAQLGRDRPASTERLELSCGQQIPGVGQTGRPDGGREQRLAGLGGIDGIDDSRKMPRPVRGIHLAVLVTVGQRAELLLETPAQAGRHQVQQAVEDVDGDRPAAVVAQLARRTKPNRWLVAH
jgi:hypothetical protein